MSEEENIIEMQKRKFSKLAIVAVMCCLLGVILYYVGIDFKRSDLPWIYPVTPRQEASTISKITRITGAMLWAVSVLLSGISQEVIKRSKGKLSGRWLALGITVVSMGLLACVSIGPILIEYIQFYFFKPP
jgi:hypothetical protein